jgi:hypothetical protein
MLYCLKSRRQDLESHEANRRRDSAEGFSPGDSGRPSPIVRRGDGVRQWPRGYERCRMAALLLALKHLPLGQIGFGQGLPVC